MCNIHTHSTQDFGHAQCTSLIKVPVMLFIMKKFGAKKDNVICLVGIKWGASSCKATPNKFPVSRPGNN